MAYLGRQPVIGNFVKLDAISVVNGQAAYTMQNNSVNFTDYATVNQFLVSLNGVIQAPTSSFTVSGSTITFASNLVTGDVIDFIIVFGNSLSAGTPTDGTVTSAKLASQDITFSEDIILGDNKKAIFGAGSDLQIYHDGSNSYVDDAGTGRLYLRGNDRVQIQKYTGEDMVTAIADGAVNLYYDNSKKLETTSDGVTVTGNLLVDKTVTTQNTAGTEISNTSGVRATVDGNVVTILNRTTSDGDIALFRKDGSTQGRIGCEGGDLIIGTGDTGVQYCDSLDSIRPWNTATNSGRDGSIDLGTANVRYNTIYAVGGSINTSDENEKQSIQSLTTAEMNVGKKLSSLIKTFKWNSAVEEKGDNARTHTGLIAQQVKQAFDDEELDASKYALWCSNTWWEKQISVEATEEKDAYTYIDTKEEATDGYTERTRLGLRYSELFAFIQAYNDQRFTELEARITTLENA